MTGADDRRRARRARRDRPGSGQDVGTGEVRWDPDGAEQPPPSQQGKGESHAVAGSDVQQPEIAEGPVEGLQPGEDVERGPWQPPVEVDPPRGDAVPRDAAGEPEAVRRQQKEGGP